jgi:hypothetical protein
MLKQPLPRNVSDNERRRIFSSGGGLQVHWGGGEFSNLSGSTSFVHLREMGYGILDFRLHIHEVRMRWAGHVSRMGDMKTAYRILVGALEAKDHLGD